MWEVIINQSFWTKNKNYNFGTYRIKIIVLVWCGWQDNLPPLCAEWVRRKTVSFAQSLFIPQAEWTRFKSLNSVQTKRSTPDGDASFGWCGWQDLNLYNLAAIRTWILRVYQFRHTRVWVIGKRFATASAPAITFFLSFLHGARSPWRRAEVGAIARVPIMRTPQGGEKLHRPHYHITKRRVCQVLLLRKFWECFGFA